MIQEDSELLLFGKTHAAVHFSPIRIVVYSYLCATSPSFFRWRNKPRRASHANKFFSKDHRRKLWAREGEGEEDERREGEKIISLRV